MTTKEPIAERKYVRVYYSIIDDPRFEMVYDNDRQLAAWLRLLLLADAMYPAPASIPTWLKPPVLSALTASGLIDLVGATRFRLHGLEHERALRSESARNAAAHRWKNGSNADAMPRRDEHRQDKTSNARAMRELPKSVQYIKDRIAAKDAGA